MILEAVYEPIFSNYSHGFRPNRSCHTALNSIKKEFTGVTWFIEGDIKGCFDNIDHHVLVDILGKKIKDARLIQLVWKFLKAGYMENWKYNSTYSGCPQGGIISPLLANIYLHELDGFAEKTAKEFFKPKDKVRSDECNRLSVQIDAIHRKLKKAKGPEKAELLRQEKKLKLERTRVPCASKTDKVMKYIRYADDFIIGVKGDRQDCEMLKQLFSVFISETLHMELSDEKTLITHSSQSARFLGYDVRVRRNQTLKPHGNHRSRTLNNKVELLIPFADKIVPFLFDKAIIRQSCDGMILPAPRKYMYRCTDLEILMTYNWELRGICNYYSIASNFSRLDYFDYLMKYSCLKTLAGKHSSTSRKIVSRYRMSDGGWGIPYETRKGRKYCVFAKYTDAKDSNSFTDTVVPYAIRHSTMRTTLEQRLSAKVCELCGRTDVPLVIHHVNKVKNLKGKQKWEMVMIAKRRKTLAVCKGCHHHIHHP